MKPVRIEIAVVCLIEAHGPLYAYLTESGAIAVAPCKQCLDRELADFKQKVREAAEKPLADGDHIGELLGPR